MSLKNAEIIGSAVRAARCRCALTAAQAAEAVGLNPLAYSRLERGRLLPSVNTLRLLAEVLHTSADVLLGLKGSATNSHTATA